MEIKTDVKLTPKQVAEAIWSMGSDEQAEMFNELYNQAGSEHKIMMQFMFTRDECESRNDNSLGVFQSMFSSAFKYMW